MGSNRAAELVFIPAPVLGHIVSMIELAKLLINHNNRLSITFLLFNRPVNSRAAAYAASLASSSVHSSGRVRIFHLPPLDADPPSTLAWIEAHKSRVKDAAAELNSGLDAARKLAGFVVDMLCTCMIDVADEIGVPSYVFYASGVAMLGLTLHVQAMHDDVSNELDLIGLIESGTELGVPVFTKPVRIATLLPYTEAESAYFLDIARSFRKAKGIIVNTFTELESHAFSKFKNVDHNGLPTVYPMGPIINFATASRGSEDRTAEIVAWLNDQPPSSVVFLCFGSLGCFREEQVKEIAEGVEGSGYRFLWTLRKPPPKGEVHPREYEDFEEVLPEGFLERTSGVGRVIGWAPQVAILSHPAIGGFVSHCGWNSVLESLWFGVPIATWPMYAEQQANALNLVRELGLGTEITLDYVVNLHTGASNFVVRGKTIERGIRSVMELKDELREKVKAMSEESKKALTKGGSSYSWLESFVEDVMKTIS